ncbi:MAG: type II toxin-antitoxin system HicA family toxin [bacterium]|nr:type II toxin-antitoxin system HicA family toxin [bacterium]
MVRIPSDVRPAKLIKLMESLGFVRDRQSGSHIIMKHSGPPGRTIAMPEHQVIKTGTLRGILQAVSEHTGSPIEKLTNEL